MVKSDSDLHKGVAGEGITGTKQQAIIVTCEVAVGNGNSSGTHDSINEPIHAVVHRNMVDPNVGRTEDGDTITVTTSAETVMTQ